MGYLAVQHVFSFSLSGTGVPQCHNRSFHLQARRAKPCAHGPEDPPHHAPHRDHRDGSLIFSPTDYPRRLPSCPRPALLPPPSRVRLPHARGLLSPPRPPGRGRSLCARCRRADFPRAGLFRSLFVVFALESSLAVRARFVLRRYLRVPQTEDGGYGLHIGGHSTMFGTVLSYVAMRLLGVDARGRDPESSETHDCSRNARSWILAPGGAANVPPCVKFYLCVLGAYA